MAGRYRGTSLIRKRLPLGTYSRPMPRALRKSRGGGGSFLMSEAPLYAPIWRGRCRAKREQPQTFQGLSPNSQHQNPVQTVLHVPSLMDSGSTVHARERSFHACHCRTNFGSMSQSRPDSGLGLSHFQYESVFEKLSYSLPVFISQNVFIN